MATRDSGITTVAVVFLTLHLILTDAAGPSLTFVNEQQLDATLGFNTLSAKIIPLSAGGYRLCVGGAASAMGRFMSRDLDASGNIPSNSNSEASPILPPNYISAISDVSAMDSKINKCVYSVLHQEGTGSSYAIVQAGVTPNPTSISSNTNILTVNASSTTQTYLLNGDTMTTTFNDLNFSGVTTVCGSVAGDAKVLYAYGRKSASVQVGFDGNGASTDTTYTGYKVACDAMNAAQWIVCWDTQDAASTVSCRNSQGNSTQLLKSQPTLYLTRPSVAYLNINGDAAVVMQTSLATIEIVIVDSMLNELLTLQINAAYGQLVADAMNNVLSVVWNNATGVYSRTYLYNSGSVVPPISITPDGTTVVPLASPSAATPGQSTPNGTPSGSPSSPSSSPVTGQTPQTNTPKSDSPKADGPVANGTVATGPNAAVDNGPTPADPNAAGADAKVLGPAIAIPLAAVGAGVFLLVFLLNKRKKKKNDKKTDGDAHEGDANLSVFNPAADPGRYSAIVGAEKNEPSHYGAIATAAKDDGINPTAIKPSEIDKRMQIPYKSLRFTKEIGAGSYGKVFVGEWRGAQVAIKVNNTITDIDGFLGEAKLTLGITPHPNLVQTFGVSLDGPNPCIVLEFCGGGSLDNVVFDREKHVTDEQRRDYALKIAYGLLHLHNNNIVHRDLAARNILLTNDGQPKISDFGMSRIIQEESSQGRTKTSFGPIRWMAPESLKDKSYSTKSDVWSYGILIYELVAGTEPHIDEDQLSIAVRIRDTAATPVIPSQCDPVLKQVMEMCWKPNPNDRPSMETIAEFLRQD